jgi:hypothetical protein
MVDRHIQHVITCVPIYPHMLLGGVTYPAPRVRAVLGFITPTYMFPLRTNSLHLQGRNSILVELFTLLQRNFIQTLYPLLPLPLHHPTTTTHSTTPPPHLTEKFKFQTWNCMYTHCKPNLFQVGPIGCTS